MTPSKSRTFLLTGVTGFLGKVMLEELVRRKDELAIDCIAVVIRPRRGRGAAERFRREVAGAECFARLPAQWDQIVTALEGNLEEVGLGLAVEDANVLRRVTHVVHAAASVKFDLPLAQAAGSNITASLNLMELARTWPKLARFVYVSTAYVTPSSDGAPIDEVLVALPVPATELYAACLDSSSSNAQLLQRTGHANNYMLTKAIAEHLLVERGGGVPLTILRPSIITAAREHPFPGWIDSTAGYAGFVILGATGHLRAVVCRPDARLDLVPVDDVTARIANSCMRDTEPLVIRHAVVGAARAPTVAQCWEGGKRFFRVHRVGRYPRGWYYLGPRGLRFKIADFMLHRLPITVAGMRSPVMRRQAKKLSARLTSLNQEFAYFCTRTFDFRTSLPLDDRYDASRFVDIAARGVYHHLLRGDEREWLLAGRSHAGYAGDLRWVLRQPNGNGWIRTAAWLATKMFRRTAESVTVDVPAFEHARAAIPDDAALVLTPSHRSYLDFVLVSYLAFARPDLIPLPHVAATSEFLPPKRGLLRCLQASGRTCALLPIAIRYDRVPEQEAFAHELAGNPKPTMGMAALLSWMFDAWRGRVDVGRIHISCAAPVLLDATSDVHACSHEVIRRLRQTMAGMVNPTSPISSTGMHQPHVADAWQPASATSRYTGVEAAG